MPQIVNKKSVLEMAMGAIAEITDYEVERVVANIMDPNTAATAKRKITITLTFAPDDYRQQIGMDAQPASDFLLRLDKEGPPGAVRGRRRRMGAGGQAQHRRPIWASSWPT